MAGNPFAAIGEAELGARRESDRMTNLDQEQDGTRHCPAGNAKDENEERPWDGNRLMRADLRLGARNALYTIRRTSEQSKEANSKETDGRTSKQANKQRDR